MDEKLLTELLEEAQRHGGGFLLNVGEQPQAVVLSVDAYSELLAGRGSSLLPNANSPAAEDLGAVPAPKQRLLVTGGAGYVGGHVVREACAQGYEVLVLDNLSTGRREHLPDDILFIEGDVRDLALLRDIFALYKIDAVVHLAALLEVGESVEKPLEYFEVNILGTQRLLWAMADAGVSRLVFSSTAAVYGPQPAMPIPEGAPCNPSSPYGATKLLAEQSIAYFTGYGKVTATVLRFFNVAGRHPDWGVFDTHERAHLVPIVLDVARGAQPVLTVYGQDWPTPDGTCVRDYVHVHDIARAHMAALATMPTEPFRVYNIGTGRGASVREVVQTAAEVTNHMIPMEGGPRRSGDDAETVADVSRATNEFGFKTMYSLEDIIRTSWQ